MPPTGRWPKRCGRPDDAAKITAIRETIEETAVVAGACGPSRSGDLGGSCSRRCIEGADFAELLTATAWRSTSMR